MIYDAYKKELKKRQEQEGGHLLKENSDTGRKKTLLMETKVSFFSLFYPFKIIVYFD